MLHIKKEELNTNTWAGGTTTQLAIYPKEATYKNLDFIFRISTATIEVEQSTFTILTNINRVLMILNGELTIHHQNKYSKQLKKFDVDTFSGDWQTAGVGKVTDFNVMTQGSAIGTAQGFSLQEKETKELILDSNYLLIYISSGKVDVENVIAHQGDALFFANESKTDKILLQALLSSDVALARVIL